MIYSYRVFDEYISCRIDITIMVSTKFWTYEFLFWPHVIYYHSTTRTSPCSITFIHIVNTKILIFLSLLFKPYLKFKMAQCQHISFCFLTQQRGSLHHFLALERWKEHVTIIVQKVFYCLPVTFINKVFDFLRTEHFLFGLLLFFVSHSDCKSFILYQLLLTYNIL